ncbi:MAG: hypothetical protein ABIJ48_03420 [Actinomycetota bacterium]
MPAAPRGLFVFLQSMLGRVLAAVVFLLAVGVLIGALVAIRGGPEGVVPQEQPAGQTTSSAGETTTGVAACQPREYRGSITGTVEGFSGGVARFDEVTFTLAEDCSLQARLRRLMEYDSADYGPYCVAFVGSGNGVVDPAATELNLEVGGHVGTVGGPCPMADGQPGDLGPCLSPLDHPWPTLAGTIGEGQIQGSLRIRHTYATMQITVSANS